MRRSISRLEEGRPGLLPRIILIVCLACALVYTAVKTEPWKRINLFEEGALDKIPVSKIVIEGWQKENEAKWAITGEKISDLLEAELSANDTFYFVKPKGEEELHFVVILRLSGVAKEEAAGRGGGRGERVHFELHINPRGGGRMQRLSSVGEVYKEGSEKEEAVSDEELFAAAIRKTLLNISAAIDVKRLSEAELLSLLDSHSSKGVKLEAISRLGELKSASAVERLILFLRDKNRDAELASRALGALAQIGDERAVLDVISFFSLEKGMEAIQAINFSADIGGEEARAFLFVMKNGHKEEAVRAIAKKALERLENAPYKEGQALLQGTGADEQAIIKEEDK